jgi:hypothetical protein
MQSHYYHKELILEQNRGEYKPMYQLIFDTPQYSDTHHFLNPSTEHSSTYKTAYTRGMYNNILISLYITF